MIKVEVKKIGDQEMILSLKNFGRDVGLLTEPLEDSARYMQQQAIMNFAAGGTLMQPGGWKDLEESTKRKKKKLVGFVYPMLVRYDKLRHAFEIEGPRIGKDYGEIEVYNPLHYAIEHQAAWGLLPQRILLQFQKQQIQDITNITTRWLDKIINRNFK